MRPRYALISALFIALPVTAMAQEQRAKDSSTIIFYLENDVFTGTDSNYTSGMGLTWISSDLTDYRENPRLPEWSYPIIEQLLFINEPGFQRSVSLSVGQNIYTP